MFLVLMLLVAGRLSDEAPWKAYEPWTLAAIVEEHRAVRGDAREGDYVLDPGTDRHRVTVRYVGKPRPIPESRRAFLDVWAKSIQISRSVGDLFDEEILVEEGSREYWVPVQKVLMPALEAELEPGDQVELFVLFVGGRVPDWIFLVNEFEALRGPNPQGASSHGRASRNSPGAAHPEPRPLSRARATAAPQK